MSRTGLDTFISSFLTSTRRRASYRPRPTKPPAYFGPFIRDGKRRGKAEPRDGVLEGPLPDEPVLEDLEVREIVDPGALELGYDPGYGLVGTGHAAGKGSPDLVDDLAGGRGVGVEHLQEAVPLYAVGLDAGPRLYARGGARLGEEAHLAHDGGSLDGGQVLTVSGEHHFMHLDGPGGNHVQHLLRPALLEDCLPRLEAGRLQQLLQLFPLLVVKVPEKRHVLQARRPLHP